MGIISLASGNSCWRGLQEEYEKEQKNEYNEVIKYLNKMSKKELIGELIQIFDYGELVSRPYGKNQKTNRRRFKNGRYCNRNIRCKNTNI